MDHESHFTFTLDRLLRVGLIHLALVNGQVQLYSCERVSFSARGIQRGWKASPTPGSMSSTVHCCCCSLITGRRRTCGDPSSWHSTRGNVTPRRRSTHALMSYMPRCAAPVGKAKRNSGDFLGFHVRQESTDSTGIQAIPALAFSRNEYQVQRP